jgi:hypothetical protein
MGGTTLALVLWKTALKYRVQARLSSTLERQLGPFFANHTPAQREPLSIHHEARLQQNPCFHSTPTATLS